MEAEIVMIVTIGTKIVAMKETAITLTVKVEMSMIGIIEARIATTAG